jgi:hypothetical protein
MHGRASGVFGTTGASLRKGEQGISGNDDGNGDGEVFLYSTTGRQQSSVNGSFAKSRTPGHSPGTSGTECESVARR